MACLLYDYNIHTEYTFSDQEVTQEDTILKKNYIMHEILNYTKLCISNNRHFTFIYCVAMQ